MSGEFIYVRNSHNSKEKNAYKLGKSRNLRARDKHYSTGEVIRGVFILVLEIYDRNMDQAEKILHKEFKEDNVRYNAGKEFFKTLILDKIEPTLEKHGIRYRKLTEEQINEILHIKPNVKFDIKSGANTTIKQQTKFDNECIKIQEELKRAKENKLNCVKQYNNVKQKQIEIHKELVECQEKLHRALINSIKVFCNDPNYDELKISRNQLSKKTEILTRKCDNLSEECQVKLEQIEKFNESCKTIKKKLEETKSKCKNGCFITVNSNNKVEFENIECSNTPGGLFLINIKTHKTNLPNIQLQSNLQIDNSSNDKQTFSKSEVVNLKIDNNIKSDIIKCEFIDLTENSNINLIKSEFIDLTEDSDSDYEDINLYEEKDESIDLISESIDKMSLE